MAPQSRILAWEIPWTEEPGGLQPQGGKEPGTAGHGTTQQQSERTAEDFILRCHLSKNPERLLWCSSGCLPKQAMGRKLRSYVPPLLSLREPAKDPT